MGDFCDSVPVRDANRHGKFGPQFMTGCKNWWKGALGRAGWGEELNPQGASGDRTDEANKNRVCTCCGVDTGLSALGCRGWHELRDTGFMRPSDVEAQKNATQLKQTRFEGQPTTMNPHHEFVSQMSQMSRSASMPTMRSPQGPPPMSLSVENNWAQLRDPYSRYGEVPEYDPSEPFALTAEQSHEEGRRNWSDSLSAMAGSPKSRRRSGEPLTASSRWLPAIAPPTFVPSKTEQGKPLQESTHWRTGQKTMIDKHLMKMYVVGVQ